MKKLLLFSLFFLTCAVHAQRIDKLISDLTDKTQQSVNIINDKVFYSSFVYTRTGFTETLGQSSDGTTFTHSDSDSSSKTFKWKDIKVIGVTDKGRVGLGLEADATQGIFITPAEGVTPQEIVDIIVEIHKLTAGKYDQLKVTEFRDQPLEDTDQVIENNMATDFLEISGRSSSILTGVPDYDSGENPYSIDDVRLTMSFGKRLRFDLGILGYSWMDLPAYGKYNASGDLVGTDSFSGSIGFWTPSVGLTYAFIIKPELGDHVTFEFPLSISFAPMLFGSNSTWDDAAAGGDTLFEDLFAFSYLGQGSLGATIYLSESFGLSFKGGVYYFGVNATSNTVQSTNSDGLTEQYTIKFDENESNVKPFAEFGLKFRWR